MTMSNFPGGFRNGVTIRNLPILISQANNVYYVNSNGGSDNNPGTFQLPLATIAQAITNCTASVGDLIIVMPYHAETYTSATSWSKAGVKIIGLGQDTELPTITYTTSATATISVGQDMEVSGIRVKDNVGVTVMMKLASTNVLVNYVKLYDGTSSFTTGFSIVGGGSNAADKSKIVDCYLYSAGATNGILLGEVDDQVQILNNNIVGSYSTAAIQNPTAKVLTSLQLHGNRVTNTHATGKGINIVSACTGAAYDNRVAVTVAGSEFVFGTAGSMLTAGNRGTSATILNGDYAIPFGIAPDPVTAVSAIKVIPQTTSTTVFTVTGGPILLEYLSAEVTTVVQTQACNLKFTSTDTASSTATDICAVLNITAAAVGTFLWVKADAVATALQSTAGGTGLGSTLTTGIVIPPGTVVATTSASNTGNIKYHLRYKPLQPGAYATLS